MEQIKLMIQSLHTKQRYSELLKFNVNPHGQKASFLHNFDEITCTMSKNLQQLLHIMCMSPQNINTIGRVPAHSKSEIMVEKRVPHTSHTYVRKQNLST
jgi:hypothetical protein